MLSEGVNPVLIENAARDVGMPQGPLALIDEISLPHVYQSVKEKSAAKKVLHRMLAEHGRSGTATGGGFYADAVGKGKVIWPQLTEHFVTQTRQADVEQLKQRFLSVQSLIAVSYREANLIDVVDADIASVLIWGFPSYSGGVLSYIDTLGISCFIKQCEQLAAQYGEQFKVPDWLYEKAKVSDRIYEKVA